MYFIVALINDIVGTNAQSTERPAIRKIKDFLFPIAYNVAMYVSIVFWSLYAINKDWIVVEEVEKLYPSVINHFLHTTVSIFMLIEILLPYKTYPPYLIGHYSLLTFVIIYTIWFLIVFVKAGVGVYPFFNYINWPARIGFMVANISIIPVLYNISNKLNNYVCIFMNDSKKYI